MARRPAAHPSARRGTIAAAVGACLLLGAAVPGAVPAVAADAPPTQTWYLTFHGQGEDDDASDGSDGVNQIQAYGASGDLLQSAVLVAAPTEPLSELRGMALGSDGSLFVANATQSNSAVLHFGTAATASSVRTTVAPNGVFAPGAPVNVGLDHPYGLAFTPAGDLLASSQDSQAVTRFTSDGAPDPTASAASWWAENYPDVSFAAGTLAPPATLVHAKDGGLAAPRGIAVVAGVTPSDDPTLYVADNGADAVRSYDAVTGRFLGDVLTQHDGLGSPVGLAVHRGGLYVTSEGTDDIMSLDLASGKTHQVAPEKLDHVALDHPSGIAFGADGRLYVASRVGQQIAVYTLDSKADRAVSAEVFIDHLPDQPEQLLGLALPSGDLTEVPPVLPQPSPSDGAATGLVRGGGAVPAASTASSAQLAATGATSGPTAGGLAALALLGGGLLVGAARGARELIRPSVDRGSRGRARAGR